MLRGCSLVSGECGRLPADQGEHGLVPGASSALSVARQKSVRRQKSIGLAASCIRKERLAPAKVIAAEFDPFRDEALA